MQIKKEYITPSKYTRPQKEIKELLAVVMHWTADANADAQQIRDYFDNCRYGNEGYKSAHYVVGRAGEIVQCIPENEVAYHCGSSVTDPVSGLIYTDYARRKFGAFAKDYKTLSPNLVTIGIELCPKNFINGDFTDETIQSAAELCADILARNNMTENDITTHHDVVGWKCCPKLWVNNPALFAAFKLSVGDILRRK